VAARDGELRGARWHMVAARGAWRCAAVRVAHTTACRGAAPMKNKEKPRPDGQPPRNPRVFSMGELWAIYGRTMGGIAKTTSEPVCLEQTQKISNAAKTKKKSQPLRDHRMCKQYGLEVKHLGNAICSLFSKQVQAAPAGNTTNP